MPFFGGGGAGATLTAFVGMQRPQQRNSWTTSVISRLSSGKTVTTSTAHSSGVMASATVANSAGTLASKVVSANADACSVRAEAFS